jgi:hypothetical protein
LKDNSSNEFKEIMQKRLFSDLTIKVKDHSQEIRGHKLLLSDASPVFYEKLVKSQSTDYMHIDDLTFDIVKDMVNFIYDDKVQNLKDKAESLLQAAVLVS